MSVSNAEYPVAQVEEIGALQTLHVFAGWISAPGKQIPQLLMEETGFSTIQHILNARKNHGKFYTGRIPEPDTVNIDGELFKFVTEGPLVPGKLNEYGLIATHSSRFGIAIRYNRDCWLFVIQGA